MYLFFISILQDNVFHCGFTEFCIKSCLSHPLWVKTDRETERGTARKWQLTLDSSLSVSKSQEFQHNWQKHAVNTTCIQTTVFLPNRSASNKHIKMVGTTLERKHKSPCCLTFSFIPKQFLRTPQSRLDMFIATTKAENFLVTSYCVLLT